MTNTSGKKNTYTNNKSCVEHDIVMRAAQHLGWGAAQSSLTNTTFLLQEIALTQHHQWPPAQLYTYLNHYDQSNAPYYIPEDNQPIFVQLVKIKSTLKNPTKAH